MGVSNEQAALSVHAVSHRYGSAEVLRAVSLQLQAGEVHCLLGPSGSGKSTLLRLIAGLEELQQGTISIAGGEVADGSSPGQQVPPERRPIGFVFQDYALFPHLNVLRNVAFGMPKPGRSAPDDRAAQALDLLRRVEMEDFASAMPHTLSGGQQQRVALARALARRPQLMLLDEPFSGLDGKLRTEVRERTLDVLRASGVAALIVTHDPQEALLSADRVSVLSDGRLLQTGPAAEIANTSNSAQVAQVFGPVNRFRATVEQSRARCALGAVPAPGVPDSEAVEIIVRAEDVLLERPSAGQAPARDGVEESATDAGSAAARTAVDLRGTVADIQPSHGAQLITVALDTSPVTEVQVIELPRSSWQVGDVVVVRGLLAASSVVRVSD